VKRLYIGIDHKFNDIFAFNVTTDISNVVGSTSNYDYATTTSFGSPVGRGLYIKKAYLEAKLNPALIIRAGAADMPWVPYDENIYGYRHIENTIIDGPFGTSADWGVHVLGDLGKHLNYQVSVVNGAGYRNVKVSKNVDVEGRIGANYNGFFAAIGGYTGKRGLGIEGTPIYHTARRLDGMAGYKNDLFTLGAEYFYAKDWNNVNTLAEDSAKGYTLFGNINITKKWSVFGEHQWVQPNVWTNAALRQNYFNVGIQYEPIKIVDIALVYKRDAVVNGNFATNNGSYGPTYTTGVGCGTTTVSLATVPMMKWVSSARSASDPATMPRLKVIIELDPAASGRVKRPWRSRNHKFVLSGRMIDPARAAGSALLGWTATPRRSIWSSGAMRSICRTGERTGSDPPSRLDLRERAGERLDDLWVYTLPRAPFRWKALEEDLDRAMRALADVLGRIANDAVAAALSGAVEGGMRDGDPARGLSQRLSRRR
jgi:hypothetical protein